MDDDHAMKILVKIVFGVIILLWLMILPSIPFMLL